MAKCGYSISWVGGCKNEAEPGSTNCKKHQKICRYCRKRLIRTECEHTFTQFVCGMPMCNECRAAGKHKH